MTIHRQVLTVVVAAILAIPTVTLAQTERGTITGIVLDETKAAVPGVSINVINTGTNAHDERRVVRLGQLQRGEPAAWHVSHRGDAPGIPDVERRRHHPNAGTTARVDVTLNLGSVSESVIVVAENAVAADRRREGCDDRVEPADRRAAARRRRRDAQPVRPVSHRARSARAAATRRRSAAARAARSARRSTAFRSTPTVRPTPAETAFLTPSLEAITEFQVETNGFKPEFGQAGGGSITFASKSGTNNLSGLGATGSSATMRSTRRDFSKQTKGIYKQSDFGGSLGGPVSIPKLYNGRNRTFFFASYEGFYNKQGSNAAFRSVPTPEMWDGDFSNWVNASGQRITIYDPATTRPIRTARAHPRSVSRTTRFRPTGSAPMAKQYIALARSVLVPESQGPCRARSAT